MKKIFIIWLLLSITSIQALAENSVKNINKVSYHKIKPEIHSNLNILKTNSQMPIVLNTLMLKITLMTGSQKNAELLQKHEALYLDKIILFINKNRKVNMNTRKQKKQFKKTLRNIINIRLEKELKQAEIVQKVLITQMIIE